MIPVLFKFTFETGFSQAILYLVAVGVILYMAYTSYVGAQGSTQDKLMRAALFAGCAAALAKLGLWYALPASAFLGGKGEGVPVHTYGVMLATGFMLAVALASKLAEREWGGEEGKRKRDQVLDYSFWALLGGIGGSKVLFILINWKDYFGHGSVNLWDMISGGLVFYGGLIGAMIASYWFARKHDIQWIRFADVCIPAVSLGQCFGRLGCFSAGCCWGRVTTEGFKLGVHFPGAEAAKDMFGHVVNTASLAFQSQVADNRWVIPSTGQVFHQAVPGAVRVAQWAAEHGHTLPIHPTQLYESVGQLCMCLFLVFMRRYRWFHGQLLGMWLVGYAFLRTTVELFRGDLERGTLAGLVNSLGLTSLAEAIHPEAWYNISTSELISLGMFTAGAVILYRGGRKVWSRRGSSTSSALPGGAVA